MLPILQRFPSLFFPFFPYCASPDLLNFLKPVDKVGSFQSLPLQGSRFTLQSFILISTELN